MPLDTTTPASFVSTSVNIQSPVVSCLCRPSNLMVCSPAAHPRNPIHADAPADKSFTSTLTVIYTGVLTHQHVSKAVRNASAGVVTGVLNQIVSRSSDITAWTKFFMIAKCVLASHPQRAQHQSRNTLNSVRDRIRRWIAGDLSGLWADVVSLDINLRKRRRRKVTPDSQQDDMVPRAC